MVIYSKKSLIISKKIILHENLISYLQTKTKMVESKTQQIQDLSDMAHKLRITSIEMTNNSNSG